MCWVQRLKRVFGIDIEPCQACGGAVRVIACIEDAEGIEKILAHLEPKGGRLRRLSALAVPGAATKVAVRLNDNEGGV